MLQGTGRDMQVVFRLAGMGGMWMQSTPHGPERGASPFVPGRRQGVNPSSRDLGVERSVEVVGRPAREFASGFDAGLDGVLGETCSWDDTLLGAIHADTESLGTVSMCLVQSILLGLTQPSSYSWSIRTS